MIAVGAGGGVLGAMKYKCPQGNCHGLKPFRIIRAVREAVEILHLAAGKKLNLKYEGEIFTIPRPFMQGFTWAKSPPPKIYTCSTEPQMLRLGAQFADALQMSDVALPMLDEAMDNIKIGLERREAPAEDFRVGNFWAWHIKEDKEVSYKEARRELIYRGSLLPPYSLHHFLTEDEAQIVIDNWNSGANNEFLKAYISRSGEIQNVPETLVSTLVSALCSAGDLNDIDRELERFEVFKKAGITDLVIRLFDEPMKGLKMIGERVLPTLQ
jgi:alkanesulfonate monooxygenase SsuD/methylene tetrahydromethanopterin reductase-like flavin-dependent oxidoreductase (luciferase family)